MTIQRKIEVKPTVDELAAEFCELSHFDQARFFRFVGQSFEAWGAYPRDAQMLEIGRDLVCEERNMPGLEWVHRLAEWSMGPFPATQQSSEGSGT